MPKISNGSFFLQWVTAVTVTMIVAVMGAFVSMWSMPLWITLFDWLLFEGNRPGRQTAVGLLLGFVGTGLLIGPDQLQGTADTELAAPLPTSLAPNPAAFMD